jgi:DNA end-binding protein Ku
MPSVMAAPRSLWNGSIAFGVVTVPVKVYTATESKSVHFREVHAKDGSRIEHRRICPKEDKAVDSKELVRGYQVSARKWVELTDEEIAAAAGTQTRLIDVDHFVPASDIDPVHYDKAYYLGAQDKGRDAYALLHAALGKADRAAVGRWVFHNRERTVLVRPLGDVLALHTMRFAEEIVEPSDFDLERVRRKPSDQEIKMAGKLVEGLHTEFDPAAYEDTYREAVLKLVEAKAAGKNIELPEPEEAESADDLLAQLEASLSA